MSGITFFLQQGGIGTYLIVLAALVFLVIGTERIITLFFRLSFNTDTSVQAVREHVLAKRYTEALQVCNAKPQSPDLSVIKSALMSVENGREAMRSGLGAALLEVTHKCESRLQYLQLIANVSTLLGLFGTITGLIKTFGALASVDASEKGRLLGLGISEAMHSTAAGLSVGVAALVVHSICISKSDSIVGHAQDLGYKVIAWIEQSERMKRDA